MDDDWGYPYDSGNHQMGIPGWMFQASWSWAWLIPQADAVFAVCAGRLHDHNFYNQIMTLVYSSDNDDG